MGGIPAAAVGAIIASFVAGVVALIGLIVSKEQKTSEFRQAWIDALRGDLSSYLTEINAIHDLVKIKYKGMEEKVTALSPHYRALNTATFNIHLRINPTEDRSKDLIKSMNKFHRLALNEATISTQNIRPAEKEFIEASQTLLKFEWDRVKEGEFTFQLAKIVALVVVSASIIAGGAYAVAQWQALGAAQSTQPTQPTQQPEKAPDPKPTQVVTPKKLAADEEVVGSKAQPVGPTKPISSDPATADTKDVK